MNIFRYTSIVLLMLLANALPGQDFLVNEKSWTVEDGLPDREVSVLLQDRRGFIWAGTRQGLCRFDGYRFQTFDRNTDGFQSNQIRNILEDAAGYFWLLPLPPFKDFDIWHPVTRERTTFREKFGKNTSLPEFLPRHWSVAGNDHTIFTILGSPERLLSYHPKKGLQMTALPDSKGLIVFRASTRLWCVNEALDRLVEMDRQGKLLREAKEAGFSFFFNVAEHNSGMPFIYNQVAAHGGRGVKSWMIDRQGRLSKFPTAFYSPAMLPAAGISAIGEDLVFSLGRIFSLEGRLIHEMKTSEARFPRALLMDGRGVLWLGGDFGIRQVVVRRNQFRRYLQSAAKPGQEQQYHTMRGMQVSGQELLVNWEARGNARVDLQTGQLKGLLAREAGEVFESVLATSLGGMIIGHSKGLSYYDENGSLQKQWLTAKAVFTHCLSEPVPGMLWLGRSNGLEILELPDGRPRPYDKLNGFEELAEADIYFMGRARDSTWYLCSSKGLFHLDSRRGVLSQYSRRQTGNHYLPFDEIHHFSEDADGSLWLASRGGGLIRLLTGASAGAGGQPHYQQFTREQGLSNNTIYAVYEDERGFLWLPSDFGLMSFDKKTGQVNTFLEQDGVAHNEFNAGSHARGPDGRLYFGGLNGVTAFHPRELPSSRGESDPPFAIVSVQQFEGSRNRLEDRSAAVIRSGRILLEPEDRFFQLEFSLLNYIDVSKNRFAWQFADQREEWNHTQEHVLRFGRLPYGKHSLRVKAQDARGSWAGKVLTVDIEVRRPFYLRAWFFALVIAAAAFSVLLFLRLRTRQLRRQKAALEREVSQRTDTIRQQAEALRSLDQLKSRFFTNVSHELRTPLTLMLGPAESLLSRDYWREKDRRLIGLLWQNSRQLLKLVNEILDLSKLESGYMPVHLHAVRVEAFLQPIVAQFSSFGDSESVRLVFRYEASPGLTIWTDSGKLEKIIHNFLVNALKYTPSGKQAEFTFREEASSLLVAVRDEGPGIQAEDMPRIFDRFYQSARSEAKTQGGSGIGLALCRELAQLLEGEVWAESRVGEGSTFFFRFPRKLAPADAVVEAAVGPSLVYAGKSPAEQPPVAPPGSARLLIVEDNADLRGYMRILLGERYDITTAENGLEAWELLQQQAPPDLILTDLMMPLMNGQQLLERVKGEDALRHIPVIVLTARSDSNVKLGLLRIGVDDYLTKPFLEQELLVRIENLLRHYQERMDLAPAGEPASLEAGGRPLISREDDEWLKAVEVLFAGRVSDLDFSLEQAAASMNMGIRQFRRRIRQLTGLPPLMYLRELRLQTARSFLLQQQYATVKQVAFAVGFIDTVYFSRLYQERFGTLPSLELGQDREATPGSPGDTGQ